MSASDATSIGSENAADGNPAGLRWACVVAAVLATLPSLQLLSFLWNRADLLAHGYLIPAVFLWLIHSRRADLLGAIRNGATPLSGPPVVLLAVCFAIASVALDVATLAGLAIPLVLAASAWALGGAALLRWLALPLGFLILLVPPPPVVVGQIPAALQFAVKDLAVALLQAAGQAVETRGHLVFVAEDPLFVGDPSSGVPTVVTLLPLAATIAWFASHGVWRRLVVLASLVPFAVVGNAAKVAATVLLVASQDLVRAQTVVDHSYPLVALAIGAPVLWTLARLLR